MKKIRKLLSIILCLALTLCLALPALATEGKYTLTIKSETSGHTYEAYQIFAGDLAKVPGTDLDTLVNIKWGAGVQNTDALLKEIKTIVVSGSTPFQNCEDPNDIADVLTEYPDDAEALDAFAAVVAKYLKTTATASAPTVETTGEGDKKEYVATISGLAAGYYLVQDDTDQTIGAGGAFTKFILQIVKDANVDAKADAPTLEKKVSNTDGANYGDAAAASVGSEVYFKITSKVPDMDGYNKYFFIVNDTLSEGLTFNNDLAIKIGTDTVLDNPSDYTVTQTQDPESPTPGTGSKTKLEIVFKNFITKKNFAGQAITITYSATVNEHAEIGTTGNLNTANLVYSNNPNVEYEGDPTNPDKPKPGGNDPTGVTPNDITAVYVTAIQIHKVDTSGKVLTGAGFTLTGTGVIKTGVTQFNSFEEDERGTYYKLVNGSYTTKAPNPDGSENDLYESTTTKYSPVEDTTTNWITKSETVAVQGMVGETGVLKFEGLGTGEYTIAETTVPENYNKIEDITVVISCELPGEIKAGTEHCTWKYQIGSEVVKEAANGIIPVTIENRSGAELPSTGGIGTTIFVYGGIILMVLALGVVAVRTYSRKKNA